MVYISQPCLQTLSLIKISSELWKQGNHFECNNKRVSSKGNWHSQMKERVSALPLLNHLRRDLCAVVWLMEQELSRWLNWQKFEPLSKAVVEGVIWKYNCTIDLPGSVQRSLDRGDLSAKERFRAACHLCLASEVHSSWDQLSGCEQRHCLRMQEGFYQSDPLLDFWTYKLNGLENVIIRPVDMLKWCVLTSDHPLSAAYFWGCLTEGQRTETLVDLSALALKRVSYEREEHFKREIFLMLLSGMNQEHHQEFVVHAQVDLFNQGSGQLFLSLFDQLFPIVKLLASQPEFEVEHCVLVLKQMFEMNPLGKAEQATFINRMAQFWSLLRSSLKEALFARFPDQLAPFFRTIFHELIEDIFCDAEPEGRKRVLTTPKGRKECIELVLTGYWHHLEAALVLVLPDSDERISFKKSFLEEQDFYTELISDSRLALAQKYSSILFVGEEETLARTKSQVAHRHDGAMFVEMMRWMVAMEFWYPEAIDQLLDWMLGSAEEARLFKLNTLSKKSREISLVCSDLVQSGHSLVADMFWEIINF